MTKQLSILIPLYNHDVVPLITDLHRQVTATGAAFEILLLDDQSDAGYEEKNSLLSAFQQVKMYKLPSKAGRSVARNFLAAQAKYDYFLFMDCDTEIPDEKFVERYLTYCDGQEVVVCGGTLYHENHPQREYLLRWTYGVKNEVKPAAVRNRHPNDHFQAFNFLIHRKLFMSIRFNELLKNYGHEDTLFRYELTKRNIQVIHIDNPLYHVGIDSNLVYLEKTRQGVENLKLLMESSESQKLICHMRLLRYYQVFRKTRTVFVLFGLFLVCRKLIIHNLNGRHPNMALFNFYKLGYLCSLKYNKI